MNYRIVLGSLAAIWLAPSCAWAQPGGGEAQELRNLISALQQTLEEARGTDQADDRVTELGRPPRPVGTEPAMVVRIYDLSDLFAMAPSYPATISADLGQPERSLFFTEGAYRGGGGFGGMGMGGMGGMGGGFFSVDEKPAKLAVPSRRALYQLHAGSAPSVRTSIDDLIEAITTTIEPESWDVVGGPGSIAPLGNNLLISNEEHVHEQITTLLDSFRQRWGTLRTVSTRAYWLWLTHDELEPLLATADAPKTKSDDEIAAFGLVDEAAWKQLLERLQEEDDGARTGYRAVLTCYNGQTVHTLSGQQSLFVTGIGPEMVEDEELVEVEDEQGEVESRVAYRPELSVVQEGAALEITPITTVSGKFVVVDVHSRVAFLSEESAEHSGRAHTASFRGTGSPAELAASIDRPRLVLHRLSTTLRLPVDRLMLIGGMTHATEPGTAEPDLFLFLEVSVQELRDDVARRTATVPTKREPALETKPKPADKPKADRQARRKKEKDS
jgi:hypothetical protein